MENLITLDMLERNQQNLEEFFTKLQLDVLKKRLQKKKLDLNEKTYYYRFIRPRLAAMLSIFSSSGFKIQGSRHILPERLEAASDLLRRLEKRYRNKKIMISGSYLFSRRYNDIDAFVFTRYKKEDFTKGRLHISFLPESALSSIFFSSLSQISVANFASDLKEEISIPISDVILSYEILINSIINQEDFRHEMRDFILKAEFVSSRVILNPKSLYELLNRYKTQNISRIISNTLINSLLLGYPYRMLAKDLKRRISDYMALSEKYRRSDSLGLFIRTYNDVIDIGA